MLLVQHTNTALDVERENTLRRGQHWLHRCFDSCTRAIQSLSDVHGQRYKELHNIRVAAETLRIWTSMTLAASEAPQEAKGYQRKGWCGADQLERHLAQLRRVAAAPEDTSSPSFSRWAQDQRCGKMPSHRLLLDCCANILLLLGRAVEAAAYLRLAAHAAPTAVDTVPLRPSASAKSEPSTLSDETHLQDSKGANRRSTARNIDKQRPETVLRTLAAFVSFHSASPEPQNAIFESQSGVEPAMLRPRIVRHLVAFYTELLSRHGPHEKVYWYRANAYKFLGERQACASDLEMMHVCDAEFLPLYMGRQACGALSDPFNSLACVWFQDLAVVSFWHQEELKFRTAVIEEFTSRVQQAEGRWSTSKIDENVLRAATEAAAALPRSTALSHLVGFYEVTPTNLVLLQEVSCCVRQATLVQDSRFLPPEGLHHTKACRLDCERQMGSIAEAREVCSACMCYNTLTCACHCAPGAPACTEGRPRASALIGRSFAGTVALLRNRRVPHTV